MNQPTPINPHAQQDSQDSHAQHDHLGQKTLHDRHRAPPAPSPPRNRQRQNHHTQHRLHHERRRPRLHAPSQTPSRAPAAQTRLPEAEALINSLSSKMERQAKKEDAQSENGPTQAVSPEHERLNKKLVARIRVETGEGASIVRILNEVLEGRDRDAKPRDRIEAAKVLLSWCFGNPSTPRPGVHVLLLPLPPRLHLRLPRP